MNFSTAGQFQRLDKEEQEKWTKFVEAGELVLLDSDYINVNDIIPYIDNFVDETGCYLRKVAYDPARYEILKELIERYFFDVDGDNQKPIRQGYAMSDYIKMFKVQVELDNVHHNQDILEWAMMNTAVKIGVSDDYMYTKKLDKDKIDPVVAMTMAMEVLVLSEI